MSINPANLPIVSEDLEILLAEIPLFTMKLKHEYILPEHLLYLLLKRETIRNIIYRLGSDPEEIKTQIEDFFETKLEKIDGLKTALESPVFSRIIHNGALHSISAEKKYYEIIDVLVSLLSEEENTHARYFLNKEGIDIYNLVKDLSNTRLSHNFEATKTQTDKRIYLNKFAVNLTELAKKGKIDPIIGRKNELNRIMQILNRRKKNNPILVGEAGVGKTAIVEGLALKISRNDVPKRIKGLSIWALDMGSLIAGTKFRGEFEDRLKKVIDEVKQDTNLLIFIDEIHTVVGAGAVGSGSLDASNILKPALQSGEIRCIGATTYDEYKNKIEKDKAFARRFQKLDICEPTENETVAILTGLRPMYEKHYSISYSLNSLLTAVKLSKKYINERFLPDKAIDVIDEAGARITLLNKKNRRKNIYVKDIEEVVASIAHIPAVKISSTDVSTLKDLENNLKKDIFGQDLCITNIVKLIKINRAGIGHPDKPIASLLFCGPTGVGKTELAKQLAYNIGINFKRYDMSEYAEKHTISKLIGAPPGYIGFDQAGLLTEALIKMPHSLILLDEIEKAHSDIYNILLQIMDYGMLTDNNGRKADFRNAIIIMTTNIGAKQLDINTIGFKNSENIQNRTEKEVEKYFNPEFRNRLDNTLYFNRLNFQLMKEIVNKFFKQISIGFAKKNVSLKLQESALIWFAKNAYDPKLGARPVERLMRKEIQEKLVDEILFGKLLKGGAVDISCKKDNITFNIQRT